MRRPLAVFAALVALVALLLGDLPGPHRCALKDAAAAHLADAHDCCPDGQNAAPSAHDEPNSPRPELCEGDCCGPDGELGLLAWTFPLPSIAVRDLHPVRPVGALFVPRTPVRFMAARPRGPPDLPPGDPPWLRHRALLL